MHTALEIAVRLAEAFPDDPCRGDFALYRRGIEKELYIFGFCLGPPFW